MSNQRRSQKTTSLTIELSDERRCNLEDDESFEETKKGAMVGNRHVMTPTACLPRKSSINATPKSRVIEPGKIFTMRLMTPVSASGNRNRANPLITDQKSKKSNALNTGSVLNGSGLITYP